MGMFGHCRVHHGEEQLGEVQGAIVILSETKDLRSCSIVNLGTGSSPWSQDDRSVEVYCRHIFDTR